MQYPMLNMRKPPGLRGEGQVARMRLMIGAQRPFDAKITGARGGSIRPVVKAGAQQRGTYQRIGALRGGIGGGTPIRVAPVTASDIHASPVGTMNVKRWRGVGARNLPVRALPALGSMMGYHFGD